MIGKYPQYTRYIPSLVETTEKDHPRRMAMIYFEGCLRGWHEKGFVPSHIRTLAGEQVDEPTPTPQVKYMDSPAAGESDEDYKPTQATLAMRARMAELKKVQ